MKATKKRLCKIKINSFDEGLFSKKWRKKKRGYYRLVLHLYKHKVGAISLTAYKCRVWLHLYHGLHIHTGVGVHLYLELHINARLGLHSCHGLHWATQLDQVGAICWWCWFTFVVFHPSNKSTWLKLKGHVYTLSGTFCFKKINLPHSRSHTNRQNHIYNFKDNCLKYREKNHKMCFLYMGDYSDNLALKKANVIESKLPVHCIRIICVNATWEVG